MDVEEGRSGEGKVGARAIQADRKGKAKGALRSTQSKGGRSR
jgi:hypothetical protein